METNKEWIFRLASHPKKGKILSAQMLYCIKHGLDPVIRFEGRVVKLLRTTQLKDGDNRA